MDLIPLDLLDVKHLMGRHNQLAHGRSGAPGHAGYLKKPGGSEPNSNSAVFGQLSAQTEAKLKAVYEANAGKSTDDIQVELGKALARELGFEAKPKVVDALPSGDEALYRGLPGNRKSGSTGMQRAEEFQNGPYFYGLGLFGNGTYTASKRSVGAKYAYSGMYINDPAVLKMSLSGKAKVIKYDELTGQQKQILGNGGLSDFEKTFAGCPSLVAMSRGYDAIRMEKQGYTNIFNRGLVTVEKNAIPQVEWLQED